MSRSTRKKSDLQSQINVVPYLDVMLVLLVIFMVTAPLINQAVIDLPSAGDIAPNQKNEALEIQMPANGGYQIKDYNFGGEETSFSSLDDALNLIRERRELFPAAPLLISADRDLPYQNVIELLARLQKDGFNNVGLVTSVGP